MSYQLILIRHLGSGGNAEVYVAERGDTHEQFAVKMLREYPSSDARKAFEREARILGLGVKGLIPVLGSNMQVERPFYVMPLMGGSLKAYAGRLNDAQLHAIAKALAQILISLHNTRDAHGDIKPDNILLSHSGQLNIADPLGNGAHCTVWFAKNRGGTPGYWAPEVRANQPISSAADVYSLGATLYELLTGKRPQDGQRLDASGEGYTAAPKIREVIAACCQFEAAARPTMREVLQMLDGREWSKIEITRLQRQQFWRGAISLSLVGVVLWALTAAD